MKKIILIFLTLDMVILDQLVKWWVIKYHPLLVYENHGVLFGYIENPILIYTLIGLGLIVLTWFVINGNKKSFSFLHLAPIVLITAGAFSNIIDRIYRGYVLDYWSMWGLNQFNLADIFIIGGVVLYSLQIFIQDKRNKH